MAAALRLTLVACGLLGLSSAACDRQRGTAHPGPAGIGAHTTDNATGAPGGRLVVLVVIDQLPSWSFERDRPLLRGGIARLIETGSYYPRAEFPYAATFTAPGHAALGSGAPPSISGILGNHWYRRAFGSKVSATYDPDHPIFDMSSADPRALRVSAEGVSPAAMRTLGVADSLEKATAGASKTVSIALKKRAAVFAIGKRPDLAIWYDDELVAWTSSTWYGDRRPPLLDELARRYPIHPRLGYVWQPRDPALLQRLFGPDDAPGENSQVGLDTSFPHDLATGDPASEAITRTPVGVAMTFEAAAVAVEQLALGSDGPPDLLAISLSTHDYAGHTWGQDSWEKFEILVAIDEQLGAFLDTLDARLGADSYSVILTSDHGAAPLVEQSQARGLTARRVPAEEMIAAVNGAIVEVAGKGDWVEGVWASSIYLSDAFWKLPAASRNTALDSATERLRAVDGIEFAGRSDQLSGSCDAYQGIAVMACRSILAGDSGAIFYTIRSLSVIMDAYKLGTSHGAPTPEDRVIPLVLRAPGRAPRVDSSSVSALRVAATLAELLGVPPPEQATGAPLR